MSDRFGNNLKNLRKSSDLSQVELAARLNVTQQTVAKWENGSREPSFDMLCILADTFHVSCDTLLGRASDPNAFIQLTAQEKKLLETFRNLNNAGRSALIFNATIISGNPEMQKNQPLKEAI